jgi:hypothetical protein
VQLRKEADTAKDLNNTDISVHTNTVGSRKCLSVSPHLLNKTQYAVDGDVVVDTEGLLPEYQKCFFADYDI